MATWPAHGSSNWDTSLQNYLIGTGQNPITGMYHADAYGDKTLKTSNVNLAIQDAAASGIGGVVYMRAGQWTCDDPINMSGTQTLKVLGAGSNLTKVVISGVSSYGFVEIVNSPGAHLEGIGFTMSSGASSQYGIAGGRPVGDASVPLIKFHDIQVYGRFTVAGIFMLAAEQAHYQEVKVWADQGAGMVCAGDMGGWTLTMRWTSLSTTVPYGGGDGLILMDRCQFTTTRNATDGPSDYPLVLEFTGSYVGNSIYTLSSGPHSIVLDKRIDSVTFRGLAQEWQSGVTGATEPYGIYCKGTTISGRNKMVRLGVEGSTIYTIYGEDNVQFTSFRVKTTGFRSTSKTYNVNLWSADTVELPVSGSAGNYTATSTSEQTTPTYNRRDGSVLVNQTPTGLLKSAQTFTFGSIAANGGVLTNTYTVTGARVGDPVLITTNPAGTTAGIIYVGGVSAVDTVQVRATNCTAAAVTPGAVTGIITVFKTP